MKNGETPNDITRPIFPTYSGSLSQQERDSQMATMVDKVRGLGFRFSNWLSDGSAVLIKRRGPSSYYAQIDGEDPTLVNGLGWKAFEKWAKEVAK